MRRLRKGEALMLRTCDSDGRSYGGFQWPQSGHVKCPDWKPSKQCGNGLHGLLWGSGDGSLLDWDENSKWLVVIVALADAVNIDGHKIKAPEGEVCYYGNRFEATELIAKYAPARTAIVGGTATAGAGGTATAGDGGTATAGDRGSIYIRYWNGDRYKMACFDVGEDNIEPNTAYRVTEKGEPQKVQS